MIKDNPHYSEGLLVGGKMAKHIEKTIYGTLDVAITKKEELVEDFKENFGWTEKDKDVAHNLGIIKALKDALALQPEVRTHNLTVDDVTAVAVEIGKTVTEEEAEIVLDLYLDAQDSDPGATWNLVIEHLIYEVENSNY